MGDIKSDPSSGGLLFTGRVLPDCALAVVDRCSGASVLVGGDPSPLRFRRKLLLRFDRTDLFDGERCRTDVVRLWCACACCRSIVPVLTVADRGCWIWLPLASSRKFPVELACESGRIVVSRSTIAGRLVAGVGVATSSSGGVFSASEPAGESFGELIGLLPTDRECSRRDALPPAPPKSSGSWSNVDRSLVRGDGGMIVTFGPVERVSLSRSDAGALLTES